MRSKGRSCANCGNPILHGFQAHHIDCNNNNNDEQNCALLCRSCHAGTQYDTLQKQKAAAIKQLDSLIEAGVTGKISGASIDKLLDGIKMSLSLQEQLYQEEYFSASPELKMEYSMVIAEAELKARTEGFLAGLMKQIGLS